MNVMQQVLISARQMEIGTHSYGGAHNYLLETIGKSLYS